MMKKFNFLFLSLFIFAFIACDDEEDVVDTEAPTILITSPVEGSEAVFDSGQNEFQVQVDADVSDNVGLDEVTITVAAPGGQPVVVHNEEVTDFLNDSREADIDETISLGNETLAPGDYVISVAAVDQSGNESLQSRVVRVMEQTQTQAITIEGLEEGQTLETLGSMQGVPVTLSFQGEEGIDSVNVSARTMDGDREILNRGFGQTFFSENQINTAGDFSFQENMRFPNTSLSRGANTFRVSTFRDGVLVDERSLNTTLEPVANATEVPFTATPAADLPEGSSVFASGNFLEANEFSRIDDPGFELMEDSGNPGTFGTTLFVDPADTRDVNFRISRRDVDGVSSFEVDQNCQEVGQDFRTFSPANDTSIAAENVNFPGLGGC